MIPLKSIAKGELRVSVTILEEINHDSKRFKV
jgi:hypothetical protein